MDAVLSVAPQATAATVLLGAFAVVMRWAHQDRAQQAKRVAAIQQRHDHELHEKDKRIRRLESVIVELRREVESEREARWEAEEREHALRIGDGQ